METAGSPESVNPKPKIPVLIVYFSQFVGRVFTPFMVAWYVVGLFVRPIHISMPTVGFWCFVVWLSRFVAFAPFDSMLLSGAHKMAGHPPLKPYRFGVVFGLVNVLAAVRFAWMATYHAENWRVSAGIMLSALFEAALGVGVLRRRVYGWILTPVWIALTLYHPVVDWSRMPADRMVRLFPVVVAFFVGCTAIGVYFWKRRKEIIGMPTYY